MTPFMQFHHSTGVSLRPSGNPLFAVGHAPECQSKSASCFTPAGVAKESSSPQGRACTELSDSTGGLGSVHLVLLHR